MGILIAGLFTFSIMKILIKKYPQKNSIKRYTKDYSNNKQGFKKHLQNK